MSRALFLLSSIFVLSAGCRHANIPDLPASHGQLSRALHDYLDLPGKVPTGASLDTPEVVVEPEQAPAVFAEAVQVLKGKPTEQQVEQASADLGGACNAPWQQACDFLLQEFTAPEFIDGQEITYLPGGSPHCAGVRRDRPPLPPRRRRKAPCL